MKIVLNILTSDILETSYQDSRDCAITRALARAGHPDFEDAGTEIQNKYNETIVTNKNETYDTLATKVLRMYKYKRNPNDPEAIPIEDFEHTLEF